MQEDSHARTNRNAERAAWGVSDVLVGGAVLAHRRSHGLAGGLLRSRAR